MRFIKPRRVPEATIQAVVYNLLCYSGVEAHMEYRIHIPEENRFIRADIVVVKEASIVAIIEVKSKKRKSNPHTRGKQYQRYMSLDVPIFYCCHMDDANGVVRSIVEENYS